MELTPIKDLSDEIKSLVVSSKQQVAQTINSTLTLLHWNIGKRIRMELLKSSRADYGSEIVTNLSKELTESFGRGWSKRQLHHCIRFAELYPDVSIVHSLSAQLNWTHLKHIISIDDELKRSFYIELCRLEKWSYRQLQDLIRSMLYERTAISRKPEETIKHDLELLKNDKTVSPDLIFKDPYILDFFGFVGYLFRERFGKCDIGRITKISH
jgi:hypothetical protein